MSLQKSVLLFSLLIVALCCNNTSTKNSVPSTAADNSLPAITEASAKLPLESIKLPNGFSI
ncbi:MAG: hypothetical protein ORN54_09800, partial [Cyclobacteriaceae bacterium]|nr:hypothetical protein [Cyclobacteriaceae bacterium]